MNTIYLDLFSGQDLTPAQQMIEDVEESYFSEQFENCCIRCDLRFLCDNDYCAKILD